jgi:hypothetical protein
MIRAGDWMGEARSASRFGGPEGQRRAVRRSMVALARPRSPDRLPAARRLPGQIAVDQPRRATRQLRR